MDVPFSELTFLLAQTSNFAYTHAKTDVQCLENQIPILSSGAATSTAESKARPPGSISQNKGKTKFLLALPTTAPLILVLLLSLPKRPWVPQIKKVGKSAYRK